MAFHLQTDAKAFDDAMRDIESTIARAATATVTQAADLIRQRGRDNIAGAGFDARWQNALQTRISQSQSINVKATIFDTIPYAGIFEDGGSISGHPLLWLPLPTVPLGVGGRPLNPRQAASRFGGLVSINRPGHRPLLAAKIGGRFAREVPLFVGVDRIEEQKKFNLRAIIDDVVSELPELFEKNIKD